MTQKPDQKFYDLADTHGLRKNVRGVFLELCRFVNLKTGQCTPAVDTVAKRLSLDARTVQRHLRTLEKKGAICTSKRFAHGVQRSNQYDIPGVAKKPAQGRQSCHPKS